MPSGGSVGNFLLPKIGLVESSVHLRFPAAPEYLQPLRGLGEKLFAVWLPGSADSSEAYEILLALQEAVTNVIRHAYKGNGGDVEVTFRFRGEEVEIEIRDWGAPFDPEKVPTPDFEHPSPGGYGVFIMRKVTDRLEFRRDGEVNIAQLTKKFPASPHLEEKAR